MTQATLSFAGSGRGEPLVVELRGELDIANRDDVHAALASRAQACAAPSLVVVIHDDAFVDASGVDMLVRLAADLGVPVRTRCAAGRAVARALHLFGLLDPA